MLPACFPVYPAGIASGFLISVFGRIDSRHPWGIQAQGGGGGFTISPIRNKKKDVKITQKCLTSKIAYAILKTTAKTLKSSSGLLEERKMEKMNLQDALKNILKFRNMSYAYTAQKMGVALQTVSDKLNKKSAMSVATLLKICEAADCEVVIRSKMKDRNEWVITEALAGDGKKQG